MFLKTEDTITEKPASISGPPPGAPPGAGPKVPPGAPPGAGLKVPPGAPPGAGPKAPPGAPPGAGPQMPPGAAEKESTEKPSGSRTGRDDRTVFVSNLAYSVDEERLREKFSEVRSFYTLCHSYCTLMLDLLNV